MATYAIGDVQGCYRSLMALLEQIEFSTNTDQLWFTGDLVNRGPDSLSCLKYVRSLGKNAVTVLGNHDLHLLAVARGAAKARRKDTFDDVLKNKQKNKLLDWLQAQPLVHHDKKLGFVMTHAGIPPQWSIKKTKKLGKEVQEILQKKRLAKKYFENMYGNEPAAWNDSLKGTDRYRTITNYLTRMRIVDKKHAMEFAFKNDPAYIPRDYTPWFEAKRKEALTAEVVFGHWAALRNAKTPKNIHAIDTGCSWGYTLTALRLEDKRRFEQAFSD